LDFEPRKGLKRALKNLKLYFLQSNKYSFEKVILGRIFFRFYRVYQFYIISLNLTFILAILPLKLAEYALIDGVMLPMKLNRPLDISFCFGLSATLQGLELSEEEKQMLSPAEQRVLQAKKRAAWREARLKSLEQDAMQAEMVCSIPPYSPNHLIFDTLRHGVFNDSPIHLN